MATNGSDTQRRKTRRTGERASPAQADTPPQRPEADAATAAPDPQPQPGGATVPGASDPATTSAGTPGPDDGAAAGAAPGARSASAFRSLAAALAHDSAIVARRVGHGARTAAGRAGHSFGAMRRDFASGGAKALAARTGSSLRGLPGALRRRAAGGSWRARLGIVAALALVLVLVGVVGVIWWAARDLPYRTAAAENAEPSIVLESATGDLIVRRGPFKAEHVPLAGFPEHLVQAVLSIEDRRFYEHGGIDLRGIARAAVRNVSAGRVVEGGSTITQQLVKIQYLDRDRTFRRKLQEAMLAFSTERRLGKDEILERYLNSIYLGGGATGVPAAARLYFDKPASELTVAESALIAGLIHAPSQLNPLRNPEGARRRAESVLGAMREEGYLDEEQWTAAAETGAALQPARPDSGVGTWFADWVIDQAREVAGAFRGAVTLRTTLEPELQALAEAAVAEVMDEKGAAAAAGQAALVAMRPDGAVVAMVGGRSYEDSEFNRAVDGLRQPGSTFKLFVYHAALKAGMTPGDALSDRPVEADGYSPENFGGNYAGRVSMAQAFAQSLNAATVNLALDLGVDKVIEAARELGIEGDLTPTPSLALGTSEVSLLDITEAYAAVRAGRAPIDAYGIQGFTMGEDGRSFRIGSGTPPPTDLSDVQRPLVELLVLAVERGTGKAARTGAFAAGKTGTSQDFRDAWFVGFTEQLVVGVWVGNDDNAPMEKVTGGSLPAEIWKRFVTAASDSVAPQAAAPADRPAAQGEGEEGPAKVAEAAPEVARCDVRACSRAYRSFRASDCTFQPYRGPRKLCEK